tara:strand:- start:378 stop:779 length:402 start_codon:yes stop_codon:yes gene_type:complete
VPTDLYVEGESFATELKITEHLIKSFADISGDINPLHTDPDYAKEKGFLKTVAYGNLLGLLISTLIGVKLKSKEVMLLTQTVNYKKPIYAGDTIILTGTVSNIVSAVNSIELKLIFSNGHQTVASGKCTFKCL